MWVDSSTGADLKTYLQLIKQVLNAFSALCTVGLKILRFREDLRWKRAEKERQAFDRLRRAASRPATSNAVLASHVREWCVLAGFEASRIPAPDSIRKAFAKDNDPERWIRTYMGNRGYFADDPYTGRETLAHPVCVRVLAPKVFKFSAWMMLVAAVALLSSMVIVGRYRHLGVGDAGVCFFGLSPLLVLGVMFAEGRRSHELADQVAKHF